MAEIIPFKGTLYNTEKIKDISKVVTPPYDVISPKEQDDFYNSDPYNIIRILFGKDFPDDNDKDNKYTRAAKFLKDWQERGILTKEREDAIYVYLQEFSVDGRIKQRLGFIALLKLEDFDTEASSIHPHENTLSAPKEDRTQLIHAIEANLGPVFALFADEDKTIDDILSLTIKSKPLMDIIDSHGMQNKLWRVSDKNTIDTVIRSMRDKELFIADGHHRYEVGLAFSKLKKDTKYGYILTYFTDLYGEGIVILPVHRLVAGVSKDILSGMEKELKKNFCVEEFVSKGQVKVFLSKAGSSMKRFVIYDGSKFIGFSINDKEALDVNLLHSTIIEPLKERVRKDKGDISVDFTKDMDYAIQEVDKGNFSCSIILNPTKVTEVRDVAFSGNRMPQKSTYFYPKVLTGLVINIF